MKEDPAAPWVLAQASPAIAEHTTRAQACGWERGTPNAYP